MSKFILLLGKKSLQGIAAPLGFDGLLVFLCTLYAVSFVFVLHFLVFFSLRLKQEIYRKILMVNQMSIKSYL
jgi:hypothetical protein